MHFPTLEFLWNDCFVAYWLNQKHLFVRYKGSLIIEDMGFCFLLIEQDVL